MRECGRCVPMCMFNVVVAGTKEKEEEEKNKIKGEI